MTSTTLLSRNARPLLRWGLAITMAMAGCIDPKTEGGGGEPDALEDTIVAPDIEPPADTEPEVVPPTDTEPAPPDVVAECSVASDCAPETASLCLDFRCDQGRCVELRFADPNDSIAGTWGVVSLSKLNGTWRGEDFELTFTDGLVGPTSGAVVGRSVDGATWCVSPTGRLVVDGLGDGQLIGQVHRTKDRLVVGNADRFMVAVRTSGAITPSPGAITMVVHGINLRPGSTSIGIAGALTLESGRATGSLSEVGAPSQLDLDSDLSSYGITSAGAVTLSLGVTFDQAVGFVGFVSASKNMAILLAHRANGDRLPTVVVLTPHLASAAEPTLGIYRGVGVGDPNATAATDIASRRGFLARQTLEAGKSVTASGGHLPGTLDYTGSWMIDEGNTWSPWSHTMTHPDADDVFAREGAVFDNGLIEVQSAPPSQDLIVYLQRWGVSN